MHVQSQCSCIWIYLQHLTLFCHIVFIMYLDLETLCYLGFNHTYKIELKVLLHMVNTRFHLLFVTVYHRDQFLDQYFLFYTYSRYQMSSNIINYYIKCMQIYKSWTLPEIVDTIKCLEQCISNVKTWMFHNKLQMHGDKNEAILLHERDWQLNIYQN